MGSAGPLELRFALPRTALMNLIVAEPDMHTYHLDCSHCKSSLFRMLNIKNFLIKKKK